MKLSEVTILFGQRAGEIAMAREYFTNETRNFVEAVRVATVRSRSDPWQTDNIRLVLAQEIETEGKVTGYLTSQYVKALNTVSFKVKGTYLKTIAQVTYGIWASDVGVFSWGISFEAMEKYHMLDDVIWAAWQRGVSAQLPAGAHLPSNNSVQFLRRPLSADLSYQLAVDDVKQVFEFLLQAEASLRQGIAGVIDE